MTEQLGTEAAARVADVLLAFLQGPRSLGVSALARELGLSKATRARPVQAAFASAASFASGAIVPVALTALVPFHRISIVVMIGSVLLLGLLGALGARTGSAPIGRAVARVMLLGLAAMLLTIGLGRMLGTSL